MRREDVAFDCAGTPCRGWLYSPSSDAASPCIVMAHGLAGVKEMRLDAYAERFALEGYRVLVFDYRGFGESGGHPRRVVDVAAQQADWRAAIAFARARPGVEPSRTVLWGTSLSGGHVLAIASERPAIAAVIAQVPHVDARAGLGERKLREWARLALHGVGDEVTRLLGRPPHRVPASGEPGSLAFMTAPEARGYLRLVPQGLDFDPSIAARSIFSLMRYSPGRTAHRIAVPTLLQIASRDRTTPAAAAAALANEIARVEIETYDTDHFSPYLGEMFERFVAGQIDFLRRHVPIDPERGRGRY